MKTLLRIDGSPRKETSINRQLATTLQKHLQRDGDRLLHRDVYYDDLVQLGNEDQVTAFFTPENQLTEAQKEAVHNSNILAQEFANADTYIISSPMYNFSVTAGLKTYIDSIARAGISFQYTENGPIGLLKNKKAYVIITTGGTKLKSPVDYVTTYLTTFLNFLGITDITFIPADEVMANQEHAISNAKELISTF
ncbi:NAD(P)H-dependent oxidoreductase [uncultured Dokdonia sp.]|uniref:FMN-dependent NADH-azoreductase n=1 Tax=uncultured Dokdonia sp. TaxID=575653 RepID=UPI00260EF934|nr:NAD(P)H-dependent oxidoreductase [uncultured Dokdonia sp.]